MHRGGYAPVGGGGRHQNQKPNPKRNQKEQTLGEVQSVYYRIRCFMILLKNYDITGLKISKTHSETTS